VQNILNALSLDCIGIVANFDGLAIECDEHSANIAEVEGPRSSAFFTVTVDNAEPIVARYGRQVGESLVNYTIMPDFDLTIEAMDDETRIETVHVWLSSNGGTSLPAPGTWIEKRIANPQTPVTLDETEKSSLANGAGLFVRFAQGPAVLSGFKLPWRLPDVDADYGFTVGVSDVALNEARPYTKIVLSRNLGPDEWLVEFDPNGERVFCRASDTDGSGDAQVEIPFYIINAIDATSTVTARLRGDTATITATIEEPATEGGTWSANFEASSYGIYDVSLVVNLDGIEKSQGVSVRVNKPAVLGLDDIQTTGGKTVTLDFGTAGSLLSITDEAVDGPYEAEWTITDGSGNETVLGRSAETQHYIFTKSMDAESESYSLSVKIWDRYGAISTTSCNVEVTNTSQGVLACDELWRGTQRIKGTVIVPAGITLTIDSNCDVSAFGIPESASLAERQAWRIEIQSGGRLTILPGARLHGEDGARWGGIRSYGECVVTGAFILNAIQGIAVAGESGLGAVVTATSFEGNVAGLHALAASPEIHNCVFALNSGYAIKEERGSTPVVTDSQFTGNAYDYYHADTGKILKPEGINALPGNAGNN
jgi:hypothetical protein